MAAAYADPDAYPLSEGALKQFRPAQPQVPVSVKSVREQLGLSQAHFAHYFGVSMRTVQEWEQGRRRPSSTACHFLRIIAVAPYLVNQVLGSGSA